MQQSQKEKAIKFHDLHHSGRILVLPNAWDIPSARVFEESGYPAVATTSGGISTSLGYPDGEKISRSEMLEVVKRIAGALSVPLTADMEAGYGSKPDELEESARQVIASGAVGLNFEDGVKKPQNGGGPLEEIEKQVEKIIAIKRAADGMNFPLFLNARTDVFLRMKNAAKEDQVREAIERGRAYKKAGADCIFIIGARDAETISEVVRALNCPINVVAGRGSPAIPELQRLGVARASIATGAYMALLGYLKKISSELKEKGTFELLDESAINYEELNRLALPRK